MELSISTVSLILQLSFLNDRKFMRRSAYLNYPFGQFQYKHAILPA